MPLCQSLEKNLLKIKLFLIINYTGDSVLEEVVEEGQIVMGGMETQQSVVMVTDGALGTHQFVITDGLDGGTQVCIYSLFYTP